MPLAPLAQATDALTGAMPRNSASLPLACGAHDRGADTAVPCPGPACAASVLCASAAAQARTPSTAASARVTISRS
ncbi:hypothetical protein ACHMW6_22295 [Pseudoduganella sp. UC29_106]|uniref:hypothetical protein n=1 Tax=Pseudoduganella sp. UC29_106 TaxID=3374553 RepID=UPI0037564AE6